VPRGSKSYREKTFAGLTTTAICLYSIAWVLLIEFEDAQRKDANKECELSKMKQV